MTSDLSLAARRLEHLAQTGDAFRAAHLRAEEIRQSLGVAIRDASESGASESEIARVAGVTRMTVRKALGK
jgi:DNA-binding GntR family transcriptional regulator